MTLYSLSYTPNPFSSHRNLNFFNVTIFLKIQVPRPHPCLHGSATDVPKAFRSHKKSQAPVSDSTLFPFSPNQSCPSDLQENKSLTQQFLSSNTPPRALPNISPLNQFNPPTCSAGTQPPLEHNVLVDVQNLTRIN